MGVALFTSATINPLPIGHGREGISPGKQLTNLATVLTTVAKAGASVCLVAHPDI